MFSVHSTVDINHVPGPYIFEAGSVSYFSSSISTSPIYLNLWYEPNSMEWGSGTGYMITSTYGSFYDLDINYSTGTFSAQSAHVLLLYTGVCSSSDSISLGTSGGSYPISSSTGVKVLKFLAPTIVSNGNFNYQGKIFIPANPSNDKICFSFFTTSGTGTALMTVNLNRNFGPMSIPLSYTHQSGDGSGSGIIYNFPLRTLESWTNHRLSTSTTGLSSNCAVTGNKCFGYSGFVELHPNTIYLDDSSSDTWCSEPSDLTINSLTSSQRIEKIDVSNQFAFTPSKLDVKSTTGLTVFVSTMPTTTVNVANSINIASFGTGVMLVDVEKVAGTTLISSKLPVNIVDQTDIPLLVQNFGVGTTQNINIASVGTGTFNINLKSIDNVALTSVNLPVDLIGSSLTSPLPIDLTHVAGTFLSSPEVPVDLVDVRSGLVLPVNATSVLNFTSGNSSCQGTDCFIPVSVRNIIPITPLGDLIGIGPNPFASPTDYAFATNFQYDNFKKKSSDTSVDSEDDLSDTAVN